MIKEKMIESLVEYISDPRLVDFTTFGLHLAPETFWVIPATRNPEFHLRTSHGVGGLFRHTQTALYVASKLMESKSVMVKYPAINVDRVFSALCLHDISKPSGRHQIEAPEVLRSLEEKYPEEYNDIMPLIKSHMGIWPKRVKNYPTPRTTEELFVHLCDYIASMPALGWFGK
jgi:hypothetical protein